MVLNKLLYDVFTQVVTLLAIQLGFTNDVAPEDMGAFISRAYKFVRTAAPQVGGVDYNTNIRVSHT